MNTFWTIFLILFLSWRMVTDFIFIIIRITKLFICRNIKNCKNRKCMVSRTCPRYSRLLTQEEYDYLTKLVENAFRNEKRQNNKDI